jgi:hypothetical protein
VDLDAKFRSLRDLLLAPEATSAIRTDNSILVVYPPEEEHHFRDQLRNLLVLLKDRGVPHVHLDLTELPFEALAESGRLDDLFQLESEDYPAARRGLARMVQDKLKQKIAQAAEAVGSGNVLLSGSMALYPVVKFADVLSDLRHLPCRIVLAFPGHERDGKLYFMNQRDGYNYLAVKLT